MAPGFDPAKSPPMAKLPIVGHDHPCLLDVDMVPWFIDKTLYMDDGGMYYTIDGRRYYVQNQVMIVACKQGRKCPLRPKAVMDEWVQMHGDPDVQAYYNSPDT